ncbi:MAG: hypothetical protein P8M49_04765 [Thalassotalea sp.]|nr:hypothetical protein [Thalassotalea sp.]MDG2392799.1 hypothetical protein [Thalassotalea sp.]
MLRITIKFILLSLLITSQFSFSTQLPLKAFAGRPDVDSVTLSPDGKKVASLVNVDTPDKTGTVISVFYVDSGKQDYVLFTDNSKFTLLDLTWANDNILLADTKYPFSRQGTPVTETRLIKIDITSKKMSSVIPSSVMKRLKYIPNVQNDVIDYLEGDDNHLLLSLSGFSHTGEPTIFKINLDGEGKSSVYQANKKHYVDWLTDVQNTIRIGIYRNKDQYKVMERKSDEDDLRELWSFDAFSAEEAWPLGFSVDPNILYVSALHAGKTAVFTVDLKDPKLAKTLVHHNESYDVSTSIRR